MKFVLKRWSWLVVLLISRRRVCAQQAEGRGFLDELKLDDWVDSLNIFGSKDSSSDKQQLRKEGNRKSNNQNEGIDANEETIWRSIQNNALLGPVFGNLDDYVTGAATTEISEGKRAFGCIMNANNGERMARRNRNRIVSFLANTPMLESIGMGVLYHVIGASSSDIDVICGIGTSYSTEGEDPGPVVAIGMTRDAVSAEENTAMEEGAGDVLEDHTGEHDEAEEKRKKDDEEESNAKEAASTSSSTARSNLRGRGQQRQLQLRPSSPEVAAVAMVEASYPSLDLATISAGRNDNLLAYLESGNLNDRAAIANVVDRLNDQIVVYQTTSQNLQASGQFISALGSTVSTLSPLWPNTELRFNPGNTIGALGGLLEGIATVTTTTTARLQRSLRTINNHKSRIDSAEIEGSYKNTRVLQQQLATASQTSQLLLQQVMALTDKVAQLESKLPE